jgi:hypothetical protein
VVGEMVLGKPGDVEAEILGHLDCLDRCVDDRGRRRIAIVKSHQIEETEFHDTSPYDFVSLTWVGNGAQAQNISFFLLRSIVVVSRI